MVRATMYPKSAQNHEDEMTRFTDSSLYIPPNTSLHTTWHQSSTRSRESSTRTKVPTRPLPRRLAWQVIHLLRTFLHPSTQLLTITSLLSFLFLVVPVLVSLSLFDSYVELNKQGKVLSVNTLFEIMDSSTSLVSQLSIVWC
jgi:hypothetical protein